MQRRHFIFFRGGEFYRLLGGAKYEQNKIVCAKTQKFTTFQTQGREALGVSVKTQGGRQGGGKCPPCLPPQNDVPTAMAALYRGAEAPRMSHIRDE